MEKEKTFKQNSESVANAWRLADDILLEVCMVQDAQKVYFDDVSNLSLAEERKETTKQRLDLLYFAGEAILKHMEEIRNGLTNLLPMIRALQNDMK